MTFLTKILAIILCILTHSHAYNAVEQESAIASDPTTIQANNYVFRTQAVGVDKSVLVSAWNFGQWFQRPSDLAETGNHSGSKMADVITIRNQGELAESLANATGGETFVLEGGDYSVLQVTVYNSSHIDFDLGLTFVAADADNPPVFHDLSLYQVQNITIDGLHFKYDAEPGVDLLETAFAVTEVSNLTIVNSSFEGDLADNPGIPEHGHPAGTGLFIRESDGIVLDNNEFTTFSRGASIIDSSNVEFTNNDVHSMQMDGLTISEVVDINIENNYFHDFIGAEGSDAHRDMIQMWAYNADTASANVTIRSNVFDSGESTNTQTIFLRNEHVDTGAGGEDMYFSNFVIEDNVIYNSQTHGIYVGQTDGLLISNNTLVQNVDTGNSGEVNKPAIWINQGATGVTITNNIAHGIYGVQEGWNTGNNLIVQLDDPKLANYAGDLFIDVLAGKDAELYDLQAIPGGVIEQMGVGSSMTQYNPEGGIGGVVLKEAGAGLDMLHLDFNASVLDESGAPVDLSGASVDWDFGDGAKGTGLSTSHTYENAGTYSVLGTVTLANNQTVEITKTIVVDTPIGLRADFDDGANDLSDIVNEVTVGENVTFEAHGDGQAVRLNGDQISYAPSTEFGNNTEFTIMMDFKKDNPTEAGFVLMMPGVVDLYVGASAIVATVVTDMGTHSLGIKGVDVYDTDWHTLALSFDGDEGHAIIYVDGAEVGRVEGFAGATQVNASGRSMYLGHPFGDTFDGLIDNFSFLKGAISAEQAASGSENIIADIGSALPKMPTPEPEEEQPAPTQAASTEPVAPANSIAGTDEDDQITGTSDADEIVGGLGKDVIWAGAGDDIIYAGSEDWGVISGDDGDDTIYGGDAIDVLFGGNGNDTIYGGAGSDAIRGGNGNDVLVGGDDRDWLYGEEGDDVLIGGNSRFNILDGGEGNDLIIGGSSREFLYGGDGNDTLVGGNGDDDLRGGLGADRFVFEENSGRDGVFDFDTAEDVIVLQGLKFNSFDEVKACAFSVDGNLIINLDGPESAFSWTASDMLCLVDVDIADLSASNFELIA